MIDLPPGTNLGQYVIQDRLARGGMASVYRAHHPMLDRVVALKVLPPTLADMPGFLERFRREARAISRLRHPNILTVFDFGSQEGVSYMVSEYLPGGTLASRLGQPLPVDEARRILSAIGSALDYAHANGVVHRDVKPSNILFTAEGTPVLSDFGIARIVESDEDLTIQGSLIGTPEYMSPEQALGESVGPLADIYSLAVVFFEMVAGRPPFKAETPIAIVMAHAHTPPPSIRSLNPDLPPAIDAVVERALRKDPAQRFPSGGALSAAVDTAFTSSRPPPALSPEPTVGPTAELEAPFPIPPPAAARSGTTEVMLTPEPTVEMPRPQPIEVPQPGSGPGVPLPVLAGLIGIAALLIGFAVSSMMSLPGFGPGATPTPQIAAAADTPTATVAPAGLTPTLGPPSPTAVVADASPATGSTGATPPSGSPTAVASGSPGITPAASPAPSPRTPVAVQLLAPRDGERVPLRPVIRGVRTGIQGPDEHLWLLIHPRGDRDNWWPYQREIIAERDGTWEITDLEIGGPPGSVHDLVVGVADADVHRLILRQVVERAGDPFADGLPPGLRPLARITVIKAGS